MMYLLSSLLLFLLYLNSLVFFRFISLVYLVLDILYNKMRQPREEAITGVTILTGGLLIILLQKSIEELEKDNKNINSISSISITDQTDQADQPEPENTTNNISTNNNISNNIYTLTNNISNNIYTLTNNIFTNNNIYRISSFYSPNNIFDLLILSYFLVGLFLSILFLYDTPVHLELSLVFFLYLSLLYKRNKWLIYVGYNTIMISIVLNLTIGEIYKNSANKSNSTNSTTDVNSTNSTNSNINNSGSTNNINNGINNISGSTDVNNWSLFLARSTNIDILILLLSLLLSTIRQRVTKTGEEKEPEEEPEITRGHTVTRI